MKYLIMFLSVIMLFCSCEEITNPEQAGDDYQIYKIVLDENFAQSRNPIVILEDSTCYDEIHGHYASMLQDSVPVLKTETLENYAAINSSKIKLGAIPGVDYVILKSQANKVSLLSMRAEMSRVGYDQDKTQAVVTLKKFLGDLRGGGNAYYLVRENDQWVLKYTQRLGY